MSLLLGRRKECPSALSLTIAMLVLDVLLSLNLFQLYLPTRTRYCIVILCR